MKECIICGNNKTVRNISFNKQGICNYCSEYFKISDKLSNYDYLEELFNERIEKIRGRYDYDAVAGLSGGKDSVFVLYELIHKYKLKVKAFTLNNGFLSDLARENIDKVVREFGVEHEYIDFDETLMKNFYRATMKKWLVPCIACSYAGYASMISYATGVNAGMCIHGRSPEQMFRMYGSDVFSVILDAGLKRADEVDLQSLYANALEAIDSKLDRELMKEVKSMLFKDVRNDDFREFVAYFLYHRYNEKEIIDFLSCNTTWDVGSVTEYSHYDCDIHNAAKYIYQELEGRPHELPELSVLVRSKEMTKEEASSKLKQLILSEAPHGELDYLCNYVGLNKNVLLLKAKIYRFLQRFK